MMAIMVLKVAYIIPRGKGISHALSLTEAISSSNHCHISV
tara:strand:+ start:1884 stop:2003 length:120 start_codon:yes stop_codon:yes gene_type:complete